MSALAAVGQQAKDFHNANRKTVNIEGKQPAVPMYDIGLLRVDAPVSKRLKIAPDSELRRLDSGYRVAYLGFPMENLVGGGVDKFNPVANMQSGFLTSVTDWWLGKAPFEKALLLSHNLAAAGGASGSPVFNAKCQVVGVLSAGNVTIQFDLPEGELVRAPSAALIHFAQRIDLLRDIYPEYPR
jgi:S1-C subfamily serine protease